MNPSPVHLPGDHIAILRVAATAMHRDPRAQQGALARARALALRGGRSVMDRLRRRPRQRG